MKTAIELADVIDNSEETTGFERRCAAMLRTQAAEIERLTGCLEKANIQAEKFEREWYLRGDENEALKAECETRKAYGDEQTEFAIKNANERDALKADAERQEAKIKALRDSLNWALSNISEEPYEWSSEEDADAHNAAIAAAKETP